MNEPHPDTSAEAVASQAQVVIKAGVAEFRRILREATGDTLAAWRDFVDTQRPICRKELPARGTE